ncbi:MAG: bleomycin resistance protein [Blastocatellia bacterium]|nr:MAG: bleomycin resistance protein [Blastocatellia bacterium]
MNSDSNLKQAVPFFGVSDMDTSIRFYIEGLGFHIKYNWTDDGKLRWCWLKRGDVALMLQEFWRDGKHEGKPEGKLGQGVSICFICEDAVKFYRELTSRNISASRPFVGNNMWVTTVIDPDGYRLEFESYTDVPEDSVLDE